MYPFRFKRNLDGVIIVDLDKCNYSYNNKYDENTVKVYEGNTAQLKSGSTQLSQSFFPLAIDDYFMAVAILSGSPKVIMQSGHSIYMRSCQHYSIHCRIH